MKKILVLTIVLTVASLANALTLQIHVNGANSGTTLTPGQTANIGIHAPNGFEQGEGIYWGVLTDPAYGALSSGTIPMPPAPDATQIADPMDYAELAELYGYPGASGVYGGIDTFSVLEDYTAPSGTYIDNILFQCVAEGNAVLLLFTTYDFESFTLVDSITISQVPEPMTISLLGIGGLLLRRFRR